MSPGEFQRWIDVNEKNKNVSQEIRAMSSVTEEVRS